MVPKKTLRRLRIILSAGPYVAISKLRFSSILVPLVCLYSMSVYGNTHSLKK